MKRLLPGILWLIVFAAPAAAQQTVFVVRHAERADAPGTAPMMGTDPDLSEAGRTRAQALATALKEAGITAIFVTEYKRTQQTAEPLAKALGIQPAVITVKDAVALTEKIKGVSGNVLVVGHSNTVPGVIAALGVQTQVTVADSEYDNLFMVVRTETPVLIRIRYR